MQDFDKKYKKIIDGIPIPEFESLDFYHTEKKLQNTGGFIMKKNIMIGVFCTVAVLGIVGAGVMANAKLDPTSVYVALKKESFKESPSEKAKEKAVAYSGKHVDITLAELKESERFYLAKGESEAEARKDALQCQMEYNALAAKAKEAGYSATEKEVDDAVAEIKELSKTPENKDVIGPIISAYPNEEEYWKYLKHVYKKQVVAQKYVKDLEASFAKKNFNGVAGASEEYNKAWRKWFDAFKKKVIREEDFKAVKGVSWLK